MTARVVLFLPFTCWLVSLSVAAQYDDLTAWAKRDKAGSNQFMIDLSQSKDAHEVALVLRASATRQHQLTSDLIDLVHRHPELRYVPELGLTNEQFRTWAEAHPEAAAKRAALPKEALKIAEDVRAYTGSLGKAPESAVAVQTLAKYREDPDVIVATNELKAVLADNEKRLMSTF